MALMISSMMSGKMLLIDFKNSSMFVRGLKKSKEFNALP
jgi:hypothetical protein